MEYFCEQAIFRNVFWPVKQNQVGFNRNANKEISFIDFYWSFMIFFVFLSNRLISNQQWFVKIRQQWQTSTTWHCYSQTIHCRIVKQLP